MISTLIDEVNTCDHGVDKSTRECARCIADLAATFDAIGPVRGWEWWRATGRRARGFEVQR